MGKTAKLSSVPAERDIEALRRCRADIRREFAETFLPCSGSPRTSQETRDEKPNFTGFWTYGDGPGVELDGAARVDAELLCNLRLGDERYVQFGVHLAAVDLRYTGDYRGYYLRRGKILKHIGKRLELFCAYSLLALHDLVHTSDVEPVAVAELFSNEQLEQTFRAFPLPIRFAGL